MRRECDSYEKGPEEGIEMVSWKGGGGVREYVFRNSPFAGIVRGGGEGDELREGQVGGNEMIC